MTHLSDRVIEHAVVVGNDGGVPIEMVFTELAPGREPAYTCLLIHGLFDSKVTWNRILNRFDSRFRLIAPDLVGFGQSSKPGFATTDENERYSPSMLAGYLRRFVENLDLGPVILIGSSLGGGLSLKLALEPWSAGPAIRGLILIDAAGYPQPLPSYIQLLAGRPGRLLTNPKIAWLARRLGIVRAIAQSNFELVLYDRSRIPPEMVSATESVLALDGALTVCHWAARNLLPSDLDALTQRYRDIRCPTLIIWGREDGVIPPLAALRFEADIPNAKLHVFEECGHAPHIEYPTETCAVMRDWIIGNV